MNAVPLSIGHQPTTTPIHSTDRFAPVRARIATWGLVLLLPPAALAFVYETEQEFYSTGDFNGDGQTDIVIVDRYTGRVRIGYRVSPEFFNWASWRASGLKDVADIAVGRITDEKFDALALVSADANAISVLAAANPNIPTDPLVVESTVLGPSAVVALDIGGEGNTPLRDLYVGSIYNPDPENLASVFRSANGTAQQGENHPAPGAATRANRLTLRAGGPDLAATLSGGATLRVESLASGKPEEVLSLGDLPAGVQYVAGNFRGVEMKDFVFYVSGQPQLLVSTLEDAGGGKFRATPPRTLALDRPVRQLVTLDGGPRTRLVAVFGTNEPAEVLDFDGANAPVLVAKLPDATNHVLNAAVALPEVVVLFSSGVPGRAANYYQTHLLKDGQYRPSSFGSLASLADRDDSTVPQIHELIVATHQEKTEADMKPYTNAIPGSQITYAMVPIPGGEFQMGSPAGEAGRKADEAPQVRVKVSPFWMGQFEVTWDQFLLFMYPDDERKLRETHPGDAAIDALSDAVTRPSKPYVDMSFGMGKSGFPAIAMTHHAANKFCHWFSAKTGHFYRLPTEAEWEYACRAGTTTAYSFGDDASKLPDYAWFFDNSNSKYQRVGKKKPNPWGLYDMHGNVMEWVLDQHDPDYYQACAAKGIVSDPWNRATKPYPHAARGGSWDDDPEQLRSAARRGSDRAWKATDPMLPKGMWYLTDAQFIGFRMVRPLTIPTPEEMTKYWISGVEKD